MHVMKKNVNIFAYRFSKGAEVHGTDIFLENGYSYLKQLFQAGGIDFQWKEVVPKIHRKSYSTDEQGYKPGTIKNLRAVVETVGSLAGKVAYAMLTDHALPLTFGGDHTQGLGTNKGMILAGVTRAILSGELPLQHVDLHDARPLNVLRNAIVRKDMRDLSEAVTALIDQEYLSLSRVAAFLDRYHVIWFDAHGDYNTTETSPSGNAHGMSAAAIAGFGDPSLTTIIGHWAKLKPKNLHFIAIRDLDEEEYHVMVKDGVHIHDMEEISRDGLKKVVDTTLKEIELAASSLGVAPHIHLSFDIDGIDARYVPATGTPVGEGSRRNTCRGPALVETIEAFSGIAYKMKAIDISEANFIKARDPQGITLQTVNRLIRAFFGFMTEKQLKAKTQAVQKFVGAAHNRRERVQGKRRMT